MLDKTHKDTILHFKGNLDYDTIGDLITSLKENMKTREVRFRIFKKVLTLMIESMENIVRYNSGSLVQESYLVKYPPEMLISVDGNIFNLETTNVIHNSDISTLSEKLTQLNNFEIEEIKELYKATITNGKFSEKGGAGLGIIEMAKIIEDKIDFSFDPLDDNHSKFSLKLQIKQSASASK